MHSEETLQQPDYDSILEKQDFFPKIFLIPSEIRLDKNHGLRVIKRYQSHQDKYEEEQILPITVDQKIIRAYNENAGENEKYIHHPAGHGLLSLFKRTDKRRIKLAICICVYSEAKHMLKSTIKGIQQSYKHFLEQAGILPHEIILIIIFDGIEKINNSKDQTQNMISFFTEIDIKNNFHYKPYAKSLQSFIKQVEQKRGNLSILKQGKIDQINIFTQDQLMSLQHKLFQNQYNQYLRIQKLLQQVTNLKKLKNLRLDSLPIDVIKRYEELCLNYCIQNNMWYETQQQIQEYLSTKKYDKNRMIYQALNDTQRLCIKYLQSRQESAILYPVRMETDELRGPATESSSQNLNSNKKQYNYMFFCVKHRNQGKLSSHMMFFQGFCKLFDPEYCILTDVGVKPQKDAIFKMWKHMQLNPKCGGVCGYMGLRIENEADDLGYRSDGFEWKELGQCTRFFDWLLSIQRAQQFQYHIAHMLDKPFEAFFNYIHVLPGAFSGYRWKALKSVSYKYQQKPLQYIPETQRYTYFDDQLSQNDEYQTLMKRYLKTATSHGSNLNLSLQDSNMYLAQDRIMCLCIHALGYDIHYLPDAESYVDPVTSLTRLLGQRRRWINGSWFAFNYVRQHSSEVNSCVFLIQLLYYSFVQKLTWIAISIFYISMNLTLVTAVREYVTPMLQRFFLTKADYELSNYYFWIFNVKNIADSLPDIVNFVYILYVFAIALFSSLVNHNNPRFKYIYYSASTLFGIYGLAIFVLLVYNTTLIVLDYEHNIFPNSFIVNITILRWLILFIIIGHALPILWTFSFRKIVQMVTSLFSYLFYIPTFINILFIFAVCRIDDLSWGTKGIDKNEETNREQRDWEKKKYVFVLQFIALNSVISYALVRATQYDLARNILILALTILVAFLLLFRLIFALLYLIKYYIKRPFQKFPQNYRRQNLEKGEKILNALNLIQSKMKQIEKIKTKRKKEQQYKRLADATSFVLSKSFINLSSKIRSKITQHIVNNNMLPKKQLLKQQNNKNVQKNKKKRLNFKKNITSQKSANQSPPMQQQERANESSDDEIYTEISPQQIHKRSDIKARINAIKGKHNRLMNQPKPK